MLSFGYKTRNQIKRRVERLGYTTNWNSITETWTICELIKIGSVEVLCFKSTQDLYKWLIIQEKGIWRNKEE